jgi:hypothetical protein
LDPTGIHRQARFAAIGFRNVQSVAICHPSQLLLQGCLVQTWQAGLLIGFKAASFLVTMPDSWVDGLQPLHC